MSRSAAAAREHRQARPFRVTPDEWLDAAEAGVLESPARRVHDRLPAEIRQRLPEELRMKITGT